jgi:hypothetical protein
MLLRRHVGGTRRGDPQPHGLSLASAAFFVIVTACSERFAAADGPSRAMLEREASAEQIYDA